MSHEYLSRRLRGMAKSFRHKMCEDINCKMCDWHGKFKTHIQALIEDGCPISHAEIKWYANDRHINVDGKFNVYIESVIYGDEPSKGRNKDHEETFTRVTTYYRADYRGPKIRS